MSPAVEWFPPLWLRLVPGPVPAQAGLGCCSRCGGTHNPAQPGGWPAGWLTNPTRPPTPHTGAVAADLAPSRLPPCRPQVSDKMDPSELVAIIATLNPDNVPGRLTIIVRMGAAKLRTKLPALLEAVQQSGHVVTWVCDPMHGNTETVQGFKTRRYDNVKSEIEAFFDVHGECGTVPGGIHLEMTGANVTECIGGGGPGRPPMHGPRPAQSCISPRHTFAWSQPVEHGGPAPLGAQRGTHWAWQHPAPPCAPALCARHLIPRPALLCPARRRAGRRDGPHHTLPHPLRPAAERGAGPGDCLLCGLPPATEKGEGQAGGGGGQAQGCPPVLSSAPWQQQLQLLDPAMALVLSTRGAGTCPPPSLAHTPFPLVLPSIAKLGCVLPSSLFLPFSPKFC